jgi:hypothetical protein
MGCGINGSSGNIEPNSLSFVVPHEILLHFLLKNEEYEKVN